MTTSVVMSPQKPSETSMFFDISADYILLLPITATVLSIPCFCFTLMFLLGAHSYEKATLRMNKAIVILLIPGTLYGNARYTILGHMVFWLISTYGLIKKRDGTLRERRIKEENERIPSNPFETRP